MREAKKCQCLNSSLLSIFGNFKCIVLVYIPTYSDLKVEFCAIENMKCNNILGNTVCDLIACLILTFGMYCSPKWLLKQEVPKVVKSINRQLREKSVKTKVEMC